MGYNIIYADPPWSYEGTDAAKCRRWKGDRGARVHYPVMSIESLCALPIGALAEKDALLYCWVTYPVLEDSFKVMRAWGFKPLTAGFLWVKLNYSRTGIFIGLGGASARSNTELCYLARRGAGVPRINNRLSQVVVEPRRRHSEKPEVVKDHIVALHGDVPRIECFARKTTPGWDCFGNEVKENGIKLEEAAYGPRLASPVSAEERDYIGR